MSVGTEITVEQLESDPYPIYEQLREEEPVCYVESVGLWLVTRWDDVQHVATHPELFTADVDSSPLTRTLGQNVLTLDGDAWRRVRATLDPAEPGDPKYIKARGILDNVEHFDARFFGFSGAA